MKRRPPINPRELVTSVPGLPPGCLFLTKPQMAAALQISIRTLTAMMARGEISFFRLRGRFIRFRFEAVERHLNETALVSNGATKKEGVV